jgi:hypothetical protein
VLSSLTTLTLDAVEQDPPRARAIEVPTYDAKLRQSTSFEQVLREERRLFLAATSQGLEQRRPLSQRNLRTLLDVRRVLVLDSFAL